MKTKILAESKIDADLQLPDLSEYLSELPKRYGRFDLYTKVTFATAVVTLHSAGILADGIRKNIGIVIGSSSSVHDNDVAYYETTLENNGAFTGPNLFSYTLPIVALGEIAVFYKFIGPTLCVGNDFDNPGKTAFECAESLLNAGQCDAVLTGWVEVSQKLKTSAEQLRGAKLTLITLE